MNGYSSNTIILNNMVSWLRYSGTNWKQRDKMSTCMLEDGFYTLSPLFVDLAYSRESCSLINSWFRTTYNSEYELRMWWTWALQCWMRHIGETCSTLVGRVDMINNFHKHVACFVHIYEDSVVKAKWIYLAWNLHKQFEISAPQRILQQRDAATGCNARWTSHKLQDRTVTRQVSPLASGYLSR